MRTLIKNGVVIDESGCKNADILIENGIIDRIAAGADIADAQIIDASGCYIFPGFIDTHTHFALEVGGTQTADDFISGTRAAILGGTTTVIDFADHQKGRTLYEALEYKKEKAKGSSCNYAFHMALSEWNERVGNEMADMANAGITSYKMYMVYGMRVDDGEIYRAMRRARELNSIVSAHCENYHLLQCLMREQIAKGNTGPMGHALSRPALVESEAVNRFLNIAMLAGAPAYVVHLSTADGLETAERIRSHHKNVYLETCPQYLFLDDERYNDPDGEKYVMSPPLRGKNHCAGLISGLRGNAIDTVGTDHCSFNMAQKKASDFTAIPNGAPGAQTRPSLYFTNCVKHGALSLTQMAEQLSTNAAKIFGMYPQKGVIKAGSDADIVIWEPEYTGVISCKALAHNCDNTPYEGVKFAGRARDVLLKGEKAVENGRIVKDGMGEYIKRGNPILYRDY